MVTLGNQHPRASGTSDPPPGTPGLRGSRQWSPISTPEQNVQGWRSPGHRLRLGGGGWEEGTFEESCERGGGFRSSSPVRAARTTLPKKGLCESDLDIRTGPLPGAGQGRGGDP